MKTLTAQQAAIIANAEAQLGKHYEFGGKGPSTFDCSGLTSWVYLHGAGITLGAGTVGQLVNGVEIGKPGDAFPALLPLLQPCDLVFPDSNHVQLWTGTDIIEAPATGLEVRRVPEWAMPPFWTPGIFAVRRVLPSDGPVSPPVPLKWPGRYLALAKPPAPYMAGGDVGEWQTQLNLVAVPRIGLAKLSVDSSYGPITAAATKAFQVARGLTADSIVGPISWANAFSWTAPA